jgi:hypothetical protein
MPAKKTTKTAATKTAAKTRKTTKAAKPAVAKKAKAKPAATNGKAQAKKLSQLDAAAQVLAETREPMNCKELVDAMAAKGYWTSPGGKTPHATLYSAILREMATKGAEARFKKTERGHFASNADGR